MIEYDQYNTIFVVAISADGTDATFLINDRIVQAVYASELELLNREPATHGYTIFQNHDCMDAKGRCWWREGTSTEFGPRWKVIHITKDCNNPKCKNSAFLLQHRFTGRG